MNKEQQKNQGFLDLLNGDKEIPFKISFDTISVTYMALAAICVGIILIIISKKII